MPKDTNRKIRMTFFIYIYVTNYGSASLHKMSKTFRFLLLLPLDGVQMLFCHYFPVIQVYFRAIVLANETFYTIVDIYGWRFPGDTQLNNGL